MDGRRGADFGLASVTDDEAHPWWNTREYKDIGHGVSYIVTNWHGDPDGEYPAGLLVKHPRPDGAGMCEASMTFDTPRNREKRGLAGAFWTVQSEQPLTLTPSLLCTECGHHGFIRDGQWIPA